MRRHPLSSATTSLFVLVVAAMAMLALACSPNQTASTGLQQSTGSSAAASPPEPVRATQASAAGTVHRVAFTGTREETERFVGYYKSIRLTPEQQRVKEEALSAIPAPCCADNPLSTCCCPCNLAKAAWGLSASLIAEQGFGPEEVRQAAQDWLAAAGPNGFSGDACYTGGCNRPVSSNGCSGMNDRHVL